MSLLDSGKERMRAEEVNPFSMRTHTQFFPKSNKLNPTLFSTSNKLNPTPFVLSLLKLRKERWIKAVNLGKSVKLSLLDLGKECIDTSSS